MKWLKWAVGEAGFRAVGMMFQKIIGGIAGGFPLVLFSTWIISVFQLSVAYGVVQKKGIHAFPKERRLIYGSILFGVGAFCNTVIAFMAYVHGANMPIYTLLTLMTIIPGAIIDRICFQESFTARLWLGIGLAVVAGWLILDMPNLTELDNMPIWMWLGFLNAIGLAINQAFSRWAKEVNVWVKNLWGGSATFVCCFVGALFVGNEWRMIVTTDLQQVFLWSIGSSLIVLGIWSFNVIAYRDGAAIPTKQVVVNGTFLGLTLFLGYLFFGDAINQTQLTGMIVYLIAFTVMNKEAWEYVTRTPKPQVKN